MNSISHGGKRKGSGRKKGEPTKVISIKRHISLAIRNKYLRTADNTLIMFEKALEYAKAEHGDLDTDEARDILLKIINEPRVLVRVKAAKVKEHKVDEDCYLRLLEASCRRLTTIKGDE